MKKVLFSLLFLGGIPFASMAQDQVSKEGVFNGVDDCIPSNVVNCATVYVPEKIEKDSSIAFPLIKEKSYVETSSIFNRGKDNEIDGYFLFNIVENKKIYKSKTTDEYLIVNNI